MKKHEWTKADLQKQYVQSKTQKQKAQNQRKPTKGLSYKELAKAVARKAGFQHKDVIEIFDALKDVIFESMEKKEYVKFDSLFTINPMLRRARQGTKLKGGESAEQMIVPPFWQARFFVNYVLDNVMKDQDVTEEQINEMYED